MQLPKPANQTRSIQKVWSPSSVPRESLPDRTVHNQSKKKISAPRLIDRQKLRSPVTVPKRRLPYVYKHSPLRSPFRKRLRFTSPSPKKSAQHAVSRENTKVSKNLFQTKTLIESIEDDDLESLQPLDTLDEEQEHETITKIDTDVSKRLFQYQAYSKSVDQNDLASSQSLHPQRSQGSEELYADCVQEIDAMLPHVLNEFSKAGIQPEIFKHFWQEVTEKRFPMQTLRSFFGLRLSNGITKRQHLECVTWTKQRNFGNLAGVTLE